MFPGPSRPTVSSQRKTASVFSGPEIHHKPQRRSAPHRRKAAPRNGKSEILATTRQNQCSHQADLRRLRNQTVANQDQDGGSIIIDGGPGGQVTIRGSLSATASSGKGGAVAVTGNDIALKGAIVDVSGATAGGSVQIGGSPGAADRFRRPRRRRSIRRARSRPMPMLTAMAAT